MPFGASITVQLARSNSGTPASLKVGTSGSAVERVSPVTAIAFDRAAIDRGLCHGDAAIEHVEVAADHVGDALRAAAIGNVRDLGGP